MTLGDTWLGVIQHIRTSEIHDLDPLFAAAAAQAVPAVDRPAADGLPEMPPSALLWTLREGDLAHIGIRVRAPLADPAAVALRLAAAALERRVVPIILTEIAISGFERFGFRVERIGGSTVADRAQCEADLVRFWALAVVIDASDVARLG